MHRAGMLVDARAPVVVGGDRGGSELTSTALKTAFLKVAMPSSAPQPATTIRVPTHNTGQCLPGGTATSNSCASICATIFTQAVAMLKLNLDLTMSARRPSRSLSLCP
jgi:hypothetical protein